MEILIKKTFKTIVNKFISYLKNFVFQAQNQLKKINIV